jgi:hypothetical protein
MINIIILGDKYQKGKKSKGCPALIYQDKKTILEHQINSIDKIIPNNKITYVCGFENEKLKIFIEKNNLTNKVSLIENKDYLKYNESYSLGLAIENITNANPILILSGYYIPHINNFNSIDLSKSTIFIDTNKKTKLGCIINNDKIVENIFFDLENYIQDIYLIQKSGADRIKNLLSTKMYNNAFLFEIINNLIDAGSVFYTHNLITKNSKTYVKQKNSYI